MSLPYNVRNPIFSPERKKYELKEKKIFNPDKGWNDGDLDNTLLSPFRISFFENWQMRGIRVLVFLESVILNESYVDCILAQTQLRITNVKLRFWHSTQIANTASDGGTLICANIQYPVKCSK